MPSARGAFLYLLLMLDNVARQLKREQEASTEAIETLRRKTLQAKQKSYASSTIDGQVMIKASASAFVVLYEERLHLLRKGQAAVDAELVYAKLKEADAAVVYLLVAKTALDVLGKESHPQLLDVSVPMSQSVHNQLRLDWYWSENKDLYKDTERYFHPSTGTRQKNTVLKRAFNKAGIEWPTWSRTVHHRVGAWLLDCFMRSTGWMTVESKQVSKLRKISVIKYSTEFLQARDTIIAQAERVAFCQWPMLCPPIAHSNEEPGGYLTEIVRQSQPVIRKSHSLRTCKQGELPLRMMNNLMSVALRINRDVLEVANHCKEHQISIGKFCCDKFIDPPASPGEHPTEEQLKEYKRARRKIEDHNAQLAQKNWRTSEVMYVANKYADEPAFYCVVSADYRGRIYYNNTALNPQGTDFDRSLLYFSEEGVVDSYYLAFNVSNAYGNDKMSMDDRIDWTYDNFSLIERIARDPIGTIPEWEVAAEPWVFMASCCEFAKCCIWKTKWTSGLPVGIDATQSGIQHLSAMTLDGTGSLVNLTPGDKPMDGYKTVAEYAANLLDEPHDSWMNRKVTKRTCMTVPYGVSRNTSRAYIRRELVEQGRDLSQPGVLSDIVYAIYDEAIPAIFPGPVNAMSWLQSAALKILETQDVICWTSPSGFEVVQDLRKPKGKRVKTRLMGSTVFCFVNDHELGDAEVDKAHHKNALAPNVVHAADAALIHHTFAYWDKPFMCIHDCTLGRSCDMREMSEQIRLHFAEMYKHPVLQDWANQVGVEVPDDLIKNTLDIELVNESDYFFC